MCIRDSHRIVDIRLKEIQDRFEENDKHYKLDVSAEAKDFLARNGYSEDMGARPLNRLIPVSYTHLDVYKRQLSH